MNGATTLNKPAKKNYNAVDFGKFIAAILVVIIHTKPLKFAPEIYGILLNEFVARLAVPFFFACSGYFFFKALEYQNGKIAKTRSNFGRLKTYIFRLVRLYLIWSLIYFVFIRFPEYYSTTGISYKIFLDFAITTVKAGSYYQFWYMLCLIFSVPVLYIILMFVNVRAIPFLALAVYLTGYFTQDNAWVDPILIIPVDHEEFYIPFASFFRAMPIILTGAYAAFAKKTLSTKQNGILAAVFFLLALIEKIVLITIFIGEEKKSIMISPYMIFCLPVIYFFFSFLKGLNIGSKSTRYLTIRGMNTFIYCVHPLILYFTDMFFNDHTDIWALNFVAVTVISVLIAYFVVRLSQNKKLDFLKYLY